MAALSAMDKQAFFALMDEYFAQRPQYAPPGYHASVEQAPSAVQSKPPPPPPRHAVPAASTAPVPAMVPSSLVHREIPKPAGLQTGKVHTHTNAVVWVRQHKLER